MRRLDGAVGDGGKYPEGPGIAIGEDDDRELHLLVQPLDEPPGAPGWLTLEVHQHRVVVLGEPVLHQTVEHSAGLDGDDEISPRLDELDLFLFHVIGYAITGITHVVQAVDPLGPALAVELLDGNVADDAGAVLLRAQFEILTHTLGDDLQVLGEHIRFVLAMELGLAPTFGDVVHFPEGGRFVLVDHVLDELERIHGPQEHHRAVGLLGGPGTGGRSVFEDPVLGIEPYVALRPQRKDHLRDLAMVDLVIDRVRYGEERPHRLVVDLLLRLCLGFFSHRSAPPISRHSRPRPHRQHLVSLPRRAPSR